MSTESPLRRYAGPALLALIVLAALYLVTLVYAVGETLLAGTILVIVGLALWIYTSQKVYAFRYLFPGIAAALIFVVFPMVYTIAIGFSNYSSKNLLEYPRAEAYLLDESFRVCRGRGLQLLAARRWQQVSAAGSSMPTPPRASCSARWP